MVSKGDMDFLWGYLARSLKREEGSGRRRWKGGGGQGRDGWWRAGEGRENKGVKGKRRGFGY